MFTICFKFKEKEEETGIPWGHSGARMMVVLVSSVVGVKAVPKRSTSSQQLQLEGNVLAGFVAPM